MPTRISAVIKAKNEETQILDCLESVRGFADEILVVNDDSSDKTAVLAISAGARVVNVTRGSQPLNVLDKVGFLSATGEWLLRLDADERLTPTLADKLKAIVAENKFSGVRFARKNMMFGDWARHGGWFRSDQLRFFRADAWDRSWNLDVHSQVPVTGPIVTLPAIEKFATVHHDYDNVPQFISRTLLGYAQQEAKERFEAGRRFSPFRLVSAPPRRFFGRYIIRGGWRDGPRGLVLAALLAAYDLCIETCLWDMGRQLKLDQVTGGNEHEE